MKTRYTNEYFQTQVNTINSLLDTKFDICNAPIYGGRCLVVIDPATGGESNRTARMEPKVFAAFLNGIIQGAVFKSLVS